MVGEVAGQFELYTRLVDGHVGGHDQRVAVALLPEAVDNCRHQAQHATGALKLDERRPVGVEAVEDLGVDGVGGLEALLVAAVATLGGELLLLGAVEIGEGTGDDVAILELAIFNEGLEEAAAHDLEALLGAGWPPRGLDAPDDVA